MTKHITFLIASCFLIAISCKNQETVQVYETQKLIDVDSMAVVTAHPAASKIGLAILEQGGNAVDAAIATQFALAVCYPIAGNIGGGGFMLYRDSSGQVSALDFREKAPRRAFQDMYLDSDMNIVKDASTLGALAVGVPGTVAGMEAAFLKGSRLKDWTKLLQPAIDLAENGFKLTPRQAKNLNNSQRKFRKANVTTSDFISRKSFKAGQIFTQKDLANTLRLIQSNGTDGFYKGPVAADIVRCMELQGGIITAEDLEDYTAKWRDPIAFDYKEYRVFSMSPPSSGGVVLAQLLNAIEPYPISDWGFQDPRSIHLMVEAEKRAFADRSVHLGDPDFYPVPVDTLISKDYTLKRMETFDPSKASVIDSISASALESEETTHFSIIDPWGGAVSVTTTLNTAFGSKVVVDGAGFILNNEMDDFSSKVGEPNFYGLVGAEANKIEAEKRMLSSMTPTIVEKEGNLFMVVGTPGGSTIITSVFQTIVNVIEFNLDLVDAIHNCRFHHQWKPEFVFLEDGCLPEETRKTLSALGHELKSRSSIGRVEAILVDENSISAVADNRGDDDARGM